MYLLIEVDLKYHICSRHCSLKFIVESISRIWKLYYILLIEAKLFEKNYFLNDIELNIHEEVILIKIKKSNIHYKFILGLWI